MEAGQLALAIRGVVRAAAAAERGLAAGAREAVAVERELAAGAAGAVGREAAGAGAAVEREAAGAAGAVEREAAGAGAAVERDAARAGGAAERVAQPEIVRFTDQGQTYHFDVQNNRLVRMVVLRQPAM